MIKPGCLIQRDCSTLRSRLPALPFFSPCLSPLVRFHQFVRLRINFEELFVMPIHGGLGLGDGEWLGASPLQDGDLLLVSLFKIAHQVVLAFVIMLCYYENQLVEKLLIQFPVVLYQQCQGLGVSLARNPTLLLHSTRLGVAGAVVHVVPIGLCLFLERQKTERADGMVSSLNPTLKLLRTPQHLKDLIFLADETVQLYFYGNLSFLTLLQGLNLCLNKLHLLLQSSVLLLLLFQLLHDSLPCFYLFFPEQPKVNVFVPSLCQDPLQPGDLVLQSNFLLDLMLDKVAGSGQIALESLGQLIVPESHVLSRGIFKFSQCNLILCH